MPSSRSPSNVDPLEASEVDSGRVAPLPKGCVPTAAELVANGVLDNLFAQTDAGELRLSGTGGLIPELIKGAVERGLQAEFTDYLSYERGNPAAGLFENHRKGTSAKTVLTEAREAPLDVPRRSLGTFAPRLVPKQRRLGGLDETIVILYAGGMTI